jgi:hypothetical protein
LAETATLIAGIGFALFGAGGALSRETRHGDVPLLMVRGLNGYIIIKPVPPGMLLVLSATKDVKPYLLFDARGGSGTNTSPSQSKRPRGPGSGGMAELEHR